MSENERLREALKSYGRHKAGCPYDAPVIVAITSMGEKMPECTCGLSDALAAKPDVCVWKEIDSEDQDTWPMDGEFVLIMCADGDHFAGTMHVCKFVPFWYRDGHMVPEFSMPGHGGIIASHWMSLPTAPAAGAKSR